MAEYAGNEGYEEVYDMIDGVLECARGNYGILAQLTRAYKRPYSQEPNYDDERYREAYLYLYSPMFSFATSKILNIFNDDLKQQLEVKHKETLNVCCIGGGPATELLVLIKVLERFGIRPSSVNCTVLDLFPKWEDTWEKMVEGHKLGIDVSMTYVECDLSQDITEEAKSAIKRADVVTHFMAYSRLESAQSHASILGNMKEESTLIYIEATCYDPYEPQTMRDRFLAEGPGGFDVLYSVEDELCNSRQGRQYTSYPGMNTYWSDSQISQMAGVTVSALILTKKAANEDGDGDEDDTKKAANEDGDKDNISQKMSAMKVNKSTQKV